MDRRMHALWLEAERRIDASLAVIVACILWCVLVPIVVMMTDVEWGPTSVVLLAAPLPIVGLCVRHLRVGRIVAQEIRARDAEEVERWNATGLRPARPDLLADRRFPRRNATLGVVAVNAALILAVCVNRWWHAQTSAMTGFALGIALAALGVVAGSLILMMDSHLESPCLLRRLVAVAWLIPVGGGYASLQLILGRYTIERALAVRALTTASYVIVGLIGMVIAFGLLALWVALVSFCYAGKALRDDAEELPSWQESDPHAVEEFEADDVAIIDQALKVERVDKIAPMVLVVGLGVLVALHLLGFAGSLLHVAVGIPVGGVFALGIYRGISV